jgi:PAS domain S-box-containing protein
VIRIIPVLFVDDNQELCTLFQLYLEETGNFSVHTCTSGEAALHYLADHKVKAIVSDYDMPEMNGIDLLRQVRKILPGLPFIMLTGNDSKETAIAALNAGADFYQNKGDDFEVQVPDLSHKILVLAGRHDAEESARKKGEILEAISYAAERLLQGSGWQEDMQEVLGHLGRATCAGVVFVTGFDELSGSHIDTVVWTDQIEMISDDPVMTAGTSSSNYVHSWWKDPRRVSLLANGQEILITAANLSDEERGFFSASGVGTLLLIPVFVDGRWWGALGITDRQVGRIFSHEEVSALRMAAGVIGSARSRMYIEEFFRNPVEESLVGVFLLRNNQFVYVNPKFCEIFGYVRDDQVRFRSPWDFVHPVSRDCVRKNILAVLHGDVASSHFDFCGLNSDGDKIHLEIYLTPTICDGFSCLFGNVMDVTDRYHARKALVESEERFRELFSNINDLVILHAPPDEGGMIQEINPVVCSSLQYDRDEILSRSLPSLCHEEAEQDVCLTHCKIAAVSGQSICQTTLVRSDGYAIPVDLSTHRVIMRDQSVLLSVARDITERAIAEAKIRSGEELLKRNMLISLREKETLLREIHHRVKNNMQIVISLLKLQDFQTDDPGVHEIIRDCSNRIYSMAIIHEKLYQTDDLTSIRLEEYFRDIAGRVISEFEPGDIGVLLYLDGDTDVFVDISIGIPLGLIINELITNCMKYAFTAGLHGEIHITIRIDGENLVIMVADSGRGLPEGFHDNMKTTLGLELIRGLAYQLRGSVSWNDDRGTCCTLTIPLPDTGTGVIL